jgi:DNA-binding NarL/FixJ family response regulator
MHAISSISLIHERGCNIEMLKSSIPSNLVVEGISDTITKKSCPIKSSIVFIVYNTKQFMVETVKKLCTLNDQLKIMLFYNNKFDTADLLELSTYSKQIIGWSHMDLELYEMQFIIKNALKGKSVLGMLQFPLQFESQEDKLNNYSGEELNLTDREIEVLTLMAEGATNKMIADTLFISENTAKTHVRRILEKLQFSSRTKAALYAIETGLVRKI